jgi:hypothetical protein
MFEHLLLLFLCYSLQAYEIRLAGGSNQFEGNVEVLTSDSVYAGICDSSWAIGAAHVVCSQLNYGKALEARTSSFFGETTNEVRFSYFECVGNEPTLDHCYHPDEDSAVGHDCTGQTLAGVVCEQAEDHSVDDQPGKPEHHCRGGPTFHGMCKSSLIGMALFLAGACFLIISAALIFYRYRVLPTRLWDPWIIARLRGGEEELIGRRKKGNVKFRRGANESERQGSFTDEYPAHVYEAYDNPQEPPNPDALPREVVERILAQMALHKLPVPSPSSDFPDITRKFPRPEFPRQQDKSGQSSSTGSCSGEEPGSEHPSEQQD